MVGSTTIMSVQWFLSFVQMGQSLLLFVINVPGCVHDSLIAEWWGNIYDMLGRIYNACGGTCTVDSALSAHQNEYLIKSG